MVFLCLGTAGSGSLANDLTNDTASIGLNGSLDGDRMSAVFFDPSWHAVETGYVTPAYEGESAAKVLGDQLMQTPVSSRWELAWTMSSKNESKLNRAKVLADPFSVAGLVTVNNVFEATRGAGE